jgi:serine/threonine protein kinase
MRLQRYSNSDRLSVNPSDLVGAGGEARVYVVPPEREFVAKVYHHPTEAQERKLGVMLANPPEDPNRDQAHISIAWPVDLLATAYSERGFAGYLMPRVPQMRPLFQVYNPSARRQGLHLFNYLYLHRAARNLASAVRALHSRGYVIGDVNESNILVSDGALITLVDTDSFQVTDPTSELVYRCPVGKAEYTPPELQGKRFSQVDRTPEHDRFGLAILIFQLLMEGTHPFAGLYQGAGDPPPYEARIVSGHFPYGSHSVPYCPMPIAPSVDILHPNLRRLFVRCFEDAHLRPSARPDATEWQHALAEAEHALVRCRVNPGHLYGGHSSACPWCERSALLGGRDPFPVDPATAERPPNRVSASSLLPSTPTKLSMRGIPAPNPASSGVAAPTPTVPHGTSSWQAIAPLTASISGGLPGALPSPTLFARRLPENGWAWGSLFCALLAVLAIPAGLPGLNWAMALLALVFGAAGWLTDRSTGKASRTISAVSAVCAVTSVAARPLTTPAAARGEAFSTRAGGVLSLSFSPDGQKLAVGTCRMENSSLTEGEVEIWDVASRRLELVPEQANGDVVSVAFSPDGGSVVAANDSPFGSSEVVLVNVTAIGSYRSAFKQRRHMRQVAWSPDGSYIASAGAEPVARIWDARSLHLIGVLGLPSEASALAFSPDGALLAVGCRSAQGSVMPGYVTVWESATGRKLWSQAAHGNGVVAVAFAHSGTILASGGNDGAICLWNARSGRLARRQTAHSYGIAALAFAPDGSQLASAETRQGEQGTVHEIVLRNAATGAPLRSLSGGPDAIQSLAYSPKGGLLASGSRDGAIRLWHVNAK